MSAKWYENNKKLFYEEKKSLSENCPFLNLEIAAPNTPLNSRVVLKTESTLVNGIYRLHITEPYHYWDYRISIHLPENYPKSVPAMFCNDKKLPIGVIDRHIMDNGFACLGVPGDISQRWRANPRIVPFIVNLVAPFLAWQVFYDEYGYPPPWGQRPHYGEGISEFYSEILKMPNGPHIMGFMKLLSRKNNPKGHEECPCGSGYRLRDCHLDSVRKARKEIAWQDVKIDLLTIESKSGKGLSLHSSLNKSKV